MIRLVTEDGPDVVALQEVPVWALGRLEGWSGMAATGAVTMPAAAGPLARPLTGLDPDRLRSTLSGQANALLVHRRLRVVRSRRIVLNPPAFRRAESRRLGLARRVRRAWARNRRVCQSLLVEDAGRPLLVGNLHATSHPDRRLAAAELLRAEELLRGDEPCVLCGDFNLEEVSVTGFTPARGGIDHILLRGLEFERAPAPWAEARRRYEAVLLSDHAPVEAVAAWS